MNDEIKRIRDSTSLSQSQFAKRYGIPLKTLKNWEQGRRDPDVAALTYLRVIEKMPEAIALVVDQLVR